MEKIGSAVPSTAAALLVAFAAGCVDGVGPTSAGATSAELVLVPVLAAEARATAAGEPTLARLTATDVESGEVYGSAELALDASAPSWSFDLQLAFPDDRMPTVVVEILLLDAAGVVVWSGRTPPLEVSAGGPPREVRVVDLYPGPPDNLEVEAVVVEPLPDLVEGDVAALAVGVVGGGPGVRLFFASLDPAVAEVDADGRVSALAPGTARILASAGPASDTVVVSVARWPLPPPETLRRVETPLSDAVERLLPNLGGDPAAAAAAAAALAEALSLAEAGEGLAASRAVARGLEALAAYGGGGEARRLDGPELSLVELVFLHLDLTLRSAR